MSATGCPSACAAGTPNRSAAVPFQDMIFWLSSTRTTESPGVPEIAAMSTEYPLCPVVNDLHHPELMRTTPVRGHALPATAAVPVAAAHGAATATLYRDRSI